MKKGENIFKRKDGRWEARYIKGYELSCKIKYGFCYGKTYKEAKEKVTKYKAALLVGKPTPQTGTRHRFAFYCDEWLHLRKSKIRESTYIKYDTVLEKHIKPTLGGCFPMGITTGVVDDFTRELLFEDELAVKTNADIFKEKKHIESELQKCIVRSDQVAELCIRCYEDNVSGKLSDEMFMRFSQKYETERLELKEKIGEYRKRLAEVEEMQLGKERFIAAVRKFMQMDKLTAPLLQELIDRIDVYEVTGTGKNRKQMIKIHYKFVGYLELPGLARQHNYREDTRKGVAVEYLTGSLPA